MITGLLCGVDCVSAESTLLYSRQGCTARHCRPSPALRSMHLHMRTHPADTTPTLLWAVVHAFPPTQHACQAQLRRRQLRGAPAVCMAALAQKASAGHLALMKG